MTPALMLNDDELLHLQSDPEAGLGALRTEKGNLPLRAVDVRARITGLSAQIELRQTFSNPHALPLEATYVFPLPDRAATTGFRFEVAGRQIDGVLKERGEARQEYDQALAAGHRAAIAEEERPGTFTMRVGNLLPGESASVQLTLTVPLLFSDGEATFRFPLVVAPRYLPGTPLPGGQVGDGVASDTDAVPDASRISPPVLLPGFPNPVRLGIEVEIDPAGLPLGPIRSSLHAVTEEGTGLVRRVRLQSGDRLNRDFVLRYTLGEDAVRSGLSVRADGEGGTFALTVLPPRGLSQQAKPRDVIFVLDRSGSMGGWKMVSARRAVARMVDTLGERDRFTVYAFDNAIECPQAFNGQGLVAATDRNRFRAVEFLAKVDARGGTEMAQPLSRAVDQLRGGVDRDRILVLATDGQVGNEDQILRDLGGRLAGLRIFTVGIDTAVNQGFLQRLAAAGGGAMEIVESEDRLDAVMDKFHRRIGTPVLTQLAIEPTGCEVQRDSLTPARLPDLFAGAPLVIGGRYHGRAGAITLRGIDSAGMPWSTTLSPAETNNGALPAQWARARLRDMEDRYVVQSNEALEKQIVATSLRFGVLCRFTAFVAVDRSEVVNQGGPITRQVQAVDAPAGWDSFAKSASVPAAAPPAMVMAVMSAPMGALGGASSGAVNAGPSRSMAMAARLSMSGAGAPPPAPSRPVTMKKMRQALGGLGSLHDQEEGGDGAIPALDLTPYRARARELSESLARGGDAPARLVALGTLIVRLSMLVDDLKSVGASGPEVAPLQALLDELTAARDRSVREGSPLAPFEETAETVLRAFAGGSGAPNAEAPRKRGFWK